MVSFPLSFQKIPHLWDLSWGTLSTSPLLSKFTWPIRKQKFCKQLSRSFCSYTKLQKEPQRFPGNIFSRAQYRAWKSIRSYTRVMRLDSAERRIHNVGMPSLKWDRTCENDSWYPMALHKHGPLQPIHWPPPCSGWNSRWVVFFRGMKLGSMAV